jgi:primosomal protein N' (replication factor Y)
VLSTALPGPLRHGDALPDTHHWGWQLTAEGRAQRGKLRAGSRPRQLAELLAEAIVDEDVLGERMDDWRTAARSLAKRELAERVALSVAPQHAQPLPGPRSTRTRPRPWPRSTPPRASSPSCWMA